MSTTDTPTAPAPETPIEAWRAICDQAPAYWNPATGAKGLALTEEQCVRLGTALERPERRVEHCHQWYAQRLETLGAWARKLPEDQCHQFFNIVANGSASPDAPPTYSQQMALLTHERNRLQREAQKLRKALEAATGEQPRWRYTATGDTYTEIGRGQLKQDEGACGWRDAVIYRADKDGAIYVRPVEQFEGGRFERIDSGAAAPADTAAGEQQHG